MRRSLVIFLYISFFFNANIAIAIEKQKGSSDQSLQNTVNIGQTLVSPREFTNNPNEVSESGKLLNIFNSDNVPLWLDLSFKLVAFIIGTWFVIWRISKEHKLNLEIKKEDFKDRLKLEIYENIAKQIHIVNQKSNFTHIGLTLSNSIKRKEEDEKISRIRQKPIPERQEKINNDFFEMTENVSELLRILEKYEIVLPNFKVFILAFHANKRELNQAYFDFMRQVGKFLPVDLLEDDVKSLGVKVVVPRYPTDYEYDQIKKSGLDFYDKCNELLSYTFDLGVEAQNLLLGNIFAHRVDGRKPADPRYIVISTEEKETKRLEKHFLENTEWGKEWTKYKSENDVSHENH